MTMRRFLSALLLTILVLAAWKSDAKAERMIRGAISTPVGQPAAGVKVKAFDEDGLTGGDDDPMGTASTDAQGKYSIGPYEDKRWDTYDTSTNWRPDIYIKVYQMIGGREVAVGRSSTHTNHRQRDDLTINLELKGIMGAVTDLDGHPVSGALVKAFDEDDLSADDFMNEVRTDANGVYAMTYDQKYGCQHVLNTRSCWDTLVPTSVSWRPDIYVEVHDVVRGRQIKINNKSVTRSNVAHSDDALISETVPRRSDIDYIVPERDPGPGVLDVLTYNTYLRPVSPIFVNGQAIRVPLITKEILRDRYDIVVLNEAFDDGLRRQLRDALASAYPYDARVPESSIPTVQDGGVKILSRWPIENGENQKGEFRIIRRSWGIPIPSMRD